MINIIKKEIEFEAALKKKLEFICCFCNTECVIKKGSIRTIERTNLSYVEPHRIIIKGITFLAFNYETNIYIENLCNKILIKDLEEHDKEVKYVDDTIAELERQILEQKQVKELKFTPEDILIKRDMDFINRVKLPMLYKAIVE